MRIANSCTYTVATAMKPKIAIATIISKSVNASVRVRRTFR